MDIKDTVKDTVNEIDKKVDKKAILLFNYVITAMAFLFFIIFTLQVKNVDVRAVGEAGSVVGYASINEFFYNLIGLNKFFYVISELIGYVAILVMAFFALIGALSLFRGKSLKSVDWKLYVLAGGYVIMLAFYVLFEKLVINMRPFILDAEEGLEASYPSSHTFLAIFVFTTAAILFPAFIKKKKYARIASIASIACMILGVLTRFLSGAHWFTDIVGSMLLGAALVSLFSCVLNVLSVRFVKK